MNKSNKREDFFLSLAINTLFLIIYLCCYKLIQESNDDLAMSFLAEGVYGEYTGRLIFENVLWGNLIVFLNKLIPFVKWYNVLHYVVMFVAFVEITYVFVRRQGRKVGLSVSAFMLAFLGYQSYVMFQFSRVTSIGTIGGILMLFYALEYAEDKKERNWCLGAGAFLSIWSSMLRFQMYALCVALVIVCLGVYRAWRWMREKNQDWLKQLGTYVAVFGVVGAVSIGLYAFDRAQYKADEEMAAYMEYNELRSNLWDTGFPDYYEEIIMYDEVGINEHDYQYFRSWNMDEETLTAEALQTIINAKDEVIFDFNYYLEYYPEKFLELTLYAVFIVLSILAIALNKKNAYFVVFEYLAIFLVELAFFHMRRFGLERVDNGMWMAAIVVLLYGMSDDLVKIKLDGWRWIFAVGVLSLFINDASLVNVTHRQEDAIGSTKAFYDQVTKDDEHLYIVLASAPSPYYAYDFWEPCGKGDLSNTYNAFGWEYNLGLKKQVLEDYGIENIYRDSINNDKIYFVPGIQVEMLQLYIQENYDYNACLYYEREYMGEAIYSVKTIDQILQE